MSKRLTNEEFINRSNIIHKNLFDYTMVDYVSNQNKVSIICVKHGIFNQAPKKHLLGQKCPSCSKTKKLSNIDFIKRSNQIHKNLYDYSLVDYINCETPVIIICKTHGSFTQLPNNHIRGIGCLKCGGKERSTTNEFVEKSNIIHNEIYDYSLVDYINNHKNVKIICKIHGIFNQSPKKHLFGRGCPTCGGSLRLTNSKFIEKSTLIHDGLYNYDNVIYKNSDTDVKILCKVHGEFLQKPRHHLRGNGCKLCGYLSKGEMKIKNILDINKIKYIQQYGFDDLRFKNPLKFDFGVIDNDNNLLYLIEYNGIQHYKYIDFLHRSEENFESHKSKDKIKVEYCIKNEIKLIIIKYDDYDKIDEILNDKFKTK